MAATVTLIPGGGIGPEVSQATVRMLEVAGADIVWEEKEAKPIVGLGHLGQREAAERVKQRAFRRFAPPTDHAKPS